MRICLGCLKHRAWSVFANNEKCFLCLPYGGPSLMLTEAEERQYGRLVLSMGWNRGNTSRMPSEEVLEALEAFRAGLLGSPETPIEGLEIAEPMEAVTA